MEWKMGSRDHRDFMEAYLTADGDCVARVFVNYDTINRWC